MWKFCYLIRYKAVRIIERHHLKVGLTWCLFAWWSLRCLRTWRSPARVRVQIRTWFEIFGIGDSTTGKSRWQPTENKWLYFDLKGSNKKNTKHYNYFIIEECHYCTILIVYRAFQHFSFLIQYLNSFKLKTSH
jgi:hypothetical protein